MLMQLLTKRDMMLFEEIKELMSYQRNFGNYRKLLRACHLPCLPFLGERRSVVSKN